MRVLGLSGVPVLLLALGFGEGVVHAETLNDALILAYQTNPTLQSERAQLRALDESYVQATAGYRPQASASVQYNYSKSPTTFQSQYDTASAGVSVNQPIYTGGLVTSEVRAAMADIESGRQKLRQTEAEVLQSVIQAYVDVRRDEQGLKIAQDNVQLLRKQLEETQARFDVGELTRTDQAQAEARLAQAHGQLATADAQLAISRSNYVAVVGQSPVDLAPEPPLNALPQTLDEAFAAADRNNAGILAADFAERAAAARVAQAKAANRPTLSIGATYSDTGVTAPSTYVSLQSQIPGVYGPSLTASVTFTQPLFTGGLNSSRIREALEDDNVQRIGVESARRQATQLVSQSWRQLLAARANAESDEKQVAADQVAFEGARQEAEAGLRTTIEVLNAEQELQAAEQSLVVARHDEYVAGAALLNAMGLLEGKTLLNGVRLYDPKAQFKREKNLGPSLPWDSAVAVIDAVGAPSVPPAPPQPAQAGGKVLP